MEKLIKQISFLVLLLFMGWDAKTQPLQVYPQSKTIRYTGHFSDSHPPLVGPIA